MKIYNVRFGFATNSSSSHSIIMLRPGNTTANIYTDDGNCYGDYQFGWEMFRLADIDSKTHYVIAQFVSNLKNEDLNFYEVQTLIKDLFGVEITEEEFGDIKWPDMSVDHQSVVTISTDNIDFWKAFHKFMMRDDVIVLGGNDNDGDVPPGYVKAEYDDVDWVNDITDKDSSSLKVRKDGDVWVFFNADRGTKTRIHLTKDSEATYTKASTPELVDLKITDYCPMGCEFCLVSGTPISTNYGVVPIEKVKKGDAVIVNDKKNGLIEQIVEEVYVRDYNDNLIEIETEDGRTLRLTPNHEVFTTNRGWIQAEEITELDDITTI